jgi:hypothetical protein
LRPAHDFAAGAILITLVMAAVRVRSMLGSAGGWVGWLAGAVWLDALVLMGWH